MHCYTHIHNHFLNHYYILQKKRNFHLKLSFICFAIQKLQFVLYALCNNNIKRVCLVSDQAYNDNNPKIKRRELQLHFI